jgi:hypothetical protein
MPDGSFGIGTNQDVINSIGANQQNKPVGMFGSSMTPEMFAIILDSIGKGMDPKNPMAGIGTMLGQTSMASQERNKQGAKDDAWKQALLTALSKGYTPPDSPGINSTKTSTNKDGVLNTVVDINPGGGTTGNKNVGTPGTGGGIDLSPF